METFLMQFGGDQSLISILYFVLLIVFFFFYPRLLVTQIMWKLEKTAKDMEDMSASTKRFITKTITSKPTKELKESVNRFFEFFVITPVALDPYGIVRKFDHVIQNEKERFSYFAGQVAPKLDKEKRANLEMGLAGGIALHELSKIIRHYVELVRKTKSYQIAMILQMQMPLIERIAKSLYVGSKALARGEPVGDGLGPLVVADMMGKKTAREIEEDIIAASVKVEGRNVFLVKAKGPGGRIGRPGKAIEKLAGNHKIVRIITIDAAAKLEGEKTGSVAEGVGVAMGGPGVDRSYIEDVIVKRNIPIDSIIVKMSPEEAIMPMRKAVKDAIPAVKESIKRSLARTKKGDNIIILGVGNTSGVGNSARAANDVRAWVDKHERKLQQMKKAKKRKKGLMDNLEMEEN
ncbi:MAG: DUF1512 family protein [Candidatus Aenigmarchaeota archaeon]|nr:DUF1512 family protein [Candidatus Aenigmarchaeota archaeon]